MCVPATSRLREDQLVARQAVGVSSLGESVVVTFAKHLNVVWVNTLFDDIQI